MTTVASRVLFGGRRVKVSLVHDSIAALSLLAVSPNCSLDCTVCCGLARKQRCISLPSLRFLNQSDCEIPPGGLVSEPSTDDIACKWSWRNSEAEDPCRSD